MTENDGPMTPARFAALAEAWGGDRRRWPAGERAGAQALLARTPQLQAVLDEAGELDAWLDAHAVAAPSPALMQAVLADRPRRPARHGWRAWIGAWQPGTRIAGAAAGAGLAGVAAGALAAALLLGAAAPALRPLPAEGGWAATAFEPGPLLSGATEGNEE